jgi:hypothetical protein
MSRLKLSAIAAVVLLAGAASAQQVADSGFDPAVERPRHRTGQGPRVAIDAAHLNFHTADGGYAPFAKLLRLDGYRVDSSQAPFAADMLARMEVLVIANAMHKQSENDWAPLPTLSAFTDGEIAAVETWVRNGGSLLLIADHMPLAGHAEALAAAFGVRFQNGFALDAKNGGLITFRRSDGALLPGAVTDGVNAVMTFTGQAFRLDPGVNAEPVLRMPAGYQLLLPEVAFQFSERTPRIPAAGLLQGAIVSHGRGRLAVFGEAAMFSAQVTGPDKRPMGMNHPEARDNARLALNVMRWLTP